MSLPAELPSSLYSVIGGITFQSSGNMPAPCKIEVIGTCVNPKVINHTTGTFYKVDTTTSDFILDNRSSTIEVLDGTVDISAYRASGSQPLFILPSENTFVVEVDNFSIDSTVTVEFTYRDTYIAS